MRSTYLITLRTVVTAAALLLPATAGAQQYPSQPVRIVLTFPPGGSVDLSVRTVGAKMSESFGQPVVIENRPGGAGQVGIQPVLRSAPDGYTLVATTSGTVSIIGHLQKLPYDPTKDLAPVAMLVFVPAAIAVNAALPIHSVSEFIKFSKARADGISYGVPAMGTNMHLAGELLKSMTGANLVAIAYKGTAPAVAALIGGQLPAVIADLTPLLPQAKSGRIRVIALVNSTRTATAPDLPTVAESGVPGYGADAWIGIFAPAAAPPSVIARLNDEATRALGLADVRQTLRNAGLEPAPMKPEEMRRFILDDFNKWGRIIKQANIKIN